MMRNIRHLPDPAASVAALSIAWLLMGCAGSTAAPSASSEPNGLPFPLAQRTISTPAPTPTASPTPGPGLPELLATPIARAAAADLDGAGADYQQLATLYPDRAEPWLGLAALAERQEDWTSALSDLQTAASVEPHSLEALRQWALLLEARGDYPSVAKVYDLMVQQSPQDANLLVARAVAYSRIGQADVALADLRSAEALDANREYAWLNAAGAAYGSRQYDAAVQIASAGLQAHPQSSGLLMQRGLSDMSLGDLASAIADFDAAIRIDSSLPAAYHWKGRALMAQGNFAQAAETLKQAADLGVNSGVEETNLAYESMAFAADAMARDNVNAAFAYLADNVVRYGSRDPLLMGYGLVRWRQGSTDQAITRMDALVKSAYEPAVFWRGAIYAATGEGDKAVVDLKYFLSLERSGPDVEAARAILQSLGVDPDAVTPAP